MGEKPKEYTLSFAFADGETVEYPLESLGISSLRDPAKSREEDGDGDAEDHPDHYAGDGEIECVDAIGSATSQLYGFEGFLVGNAIKYLWRYRLKGNPAGDLKKARWYLDRLIREVEGE